MTITITITTITITNTIAATLANQIFVWTRIAPIGTISITVIPPRLRARSCGETRLLMMMMMMMMMV